MLHMNKETEPQIQSNVWVKGMYTKPIKNYIALSDLVTGTWPIDWQSKILIIR
jgi:hypothetical protein